MFFKTELAALRIHIQFFVLQFFIAVIGFAVEGMYENTSGGTDFFFFLLIKMCGAAVMISSVFPLATDNTTKPTR